jgi:hypothetical protein
VWRSFFLAIGITMCIWGAECLVLEKAVLAGQEKAPTAQELTNYLTQPNKPSAREIKPPEWAPWSLMSTGAVVILYSFTLPRRAAG